MDRSLAPVETEEPALAMFQTSQVQIYLQTTKLKQALRETAR